MRQLLFVSSRVKNFAAIQSSVHPTVLLLHYKYETCTSQSLLDDVKLLLQGGKVDCVGFILHGTLTSINICGKDDVTLTKDNLTSNERIRHFLVSLADTCLNRGPNSRIVWFTTSLGQAADGAIFAKHLQSLLQVPVDLCRDFSGSDLVASGQLQQTTTTENSDSQLPKQENKLPTCVGELFFRSDKLKSLNSSFQQSLAGFEKIRIVGKGAYGTAVLYRKRDDDSLVILKEINLHDLNVAERTMALNEVKVLSMLNHPHIISYYDSFEEDGNMLIEMEYADGGTLSDYLSQLTQPLEERRILEMFQQIVDAIAYVHEHNILHRDIKAANIFLSRDGTLKIGDFGISKMLSTNLQNANTVLGTPYYISPEMCEGKNYDAKSDVWALGCILYEMACLQRTFDGTNLPALVNKIVKGQFAPVKGNYSEQFKQLVIDLLQQEPDKRPSAKVIANERLPKLLNRLKESIARRLSSDNSVGQLGGEIGGQSGAAGSQLSGKNSSATQKRIRSVLYYLELTSFSLFPVYLPPKTRIQEVAVGPNHVVVLTADMLVFSWGEGTKGQLGHGDWETRYQPALVESLKDKAVAHVCCGTNFTVFGSANGIVMTCGEGSKGGLGHGDWTSLNKPRLIEALLSVDAASVACGPEHVVVIGTGGVAYAWGQGSYGRLGYGSEESFCSPQRISFPSGFTVKRVRCGSDTTMFLTDLGVVLATGNNSYNKIGLNNRQGFLMAMKNIFTKTEVDGALTPTVVKSLSQYRVVDAALGPTHTVLLVDGGQVVTLGRNSLGQLGVGNRREQRRPTVVSKLKASANFIGASTTFSVAGSKTSNAVYFWGARRHPVTGGGGGRRGRQPRRIHSGNSLHRRASSTSTRSGESLSDDDSLDSVYCSSTDFEDDGDSLRAMSIAGSRERLAGGGTGSAGSERRQSSSGSHQQQQSASLQNSASKVQTMTPLPVIGAQRSLSAEGLSAAASNNSSNTGSTQPLAPSSSDASSSQNAAKAATVLQQQQQQQILQQRQRLPSFGSPGLPIGSAGSGNQDYDEELQIIAAPTHILRLQSTGTDEHREVVELSGLHCHGNNLFVHVETTAPPPRRSQAPKPTKEAFKSPKDAAQPLYDGNNNNNPTNSTPATTEARSMPGSAESAAIASRNPGSMAVTSSDFNDVPDWLRKELDEAENGSIVQLSQQSASSMDALSQSQLGQGQSGPVNRTFSIGSSLGGSGGRGAGLRGVTGGGLTTDDEDLSSVAVADDELDDEAGSVALTMTDADDNEPALAIKINPQLARGSHGSMNAAKLPIQATKPQPKPSGHRHSRSGIPPAGPTAAALNNQDRANSRRSHHKSLSISGSVANNSNNQGGGQQLPKYPTQSSTSTSASSQRPPLKLARNSSGITTAVPIPTTPSSQRSTSSRAQSDLMLMNMTGTTMSGGLDGTVFGDSSPSSSATTRVESLVRELEEKYRAEREQIRREAEEAARERERALREEIEMLRSQLALQQVLPQSQSSQSLPAPQTPPTQERVMSPSTSSLDGGNNRPPSASKTLQKQNSVKSESKLGATSASEKPNSRVCVVS